MLDPEPRAARERREAHSNAGTPMKRETPAGASRAGAAARPVTPRAPLVSVVIPTRDRPAMVRRAAASALRQTYGAIEVIVVDDGEDFAVAALPDDLGDRRVRCLRNGRARGATGARNTGILAARGEYIALLDDDDEWRPDKIARQLEALGSWDGVLCGSTSPSSRRRRLPPGVIRREILRRGRLLEGGSSALLARAEILKASLFDESLPRWQDWDLLIRLTECWTIGYMDEPLVLYNEGSHPRITNRARTLSFAEAENRLCVVHKHRNFFGPHWSRRHLARGLLAYVRHREDRLAHLVRTARRTGVLYVVIAGMERITGWIRRG